MNQIPILVRVFAYLSLLTVGGGMAAFPEMKVLTVEVNMWLTFPQLIRIYSVGQMTPGPNMMMIVVYRTMGGRLPWRHRYHCRVFRTDRTVGLRSREGLAEAGKMAVEKINSRGSGAGINRLVAGWLLYHGERSNHRDRDRSPCDRHLLILLQYKIDPALLVVAGAIIGILSFMPK
jgi:chromate transporter